GEGRGGCDAPSRSNDPRLNRGLWSVKWPLRVRRENCVSARVEEVRRFAGTRTGEPRPLLVAETAAHFPRPCPDTILLQAITSGARPSRECSGPVQRVTN